MNTPQPSLEARKLYIELVSKLYLHGTLSIDDLYAKHVGGFLTIEEFYSIGTLTHYSMSDLDV